MRSYTELRQLRFLYLEDSYVLDVVAEPGTLVLKVDLVFTEDHPDYRPPAPGDRYAYTRGELKFSGVSRLTWSGQGAQPAVDASGERDYGCVDSLEFEGSRYRIEGDFGIIDLEAELVMIEMSD